jgi:hypothetical protein
MDGWMGGWMGGKAGLGIAYSNQKVLCNYILAREFYVYIQNKVHGTSLTHTF